MGFETPPICRTQSLSAVQLQKHAGLFFLKRGELFWSHAPMKGPDLRNIQYILNQREPTGADVPVLDTRSADFFAPSNLNPPHPLHNTSILSSFKICLNMIKEGHYASLSNFKQTCQQKLKNQKSEFNQPLMMLNGLLSESPKED